MTTTAVQPAGSIALRDRPRFGMTGTQFWRGGVVARLAVAAGALIGAALDGLVIGLVVGYLVATTVSGPSKHLGLGWPIEWAVGGFGAGAFLVLGAAAGAVARRLCLLVGALLDRLAGRVAPAWRSMRIRAVLGLPGRLLRSLPMPWLGAFTAALALANLGVSHGPFGLFVPASALAPFVILGGVVTALAAAALHLRRSGRRAASRPGVARLRRATVVALASGALALSGYGGFVLTSAGSAAHLITIDGALDGVGLRTDLDDPGARGPYAVRTLSYGSGTDRWRPAFGADVSMVTPTANAAPALKTLGWGADEARRLYWGFGPEAVPINGLAWIPDGPGPFPLVLVVHGNHSMGAFSEPGYAYLAEHLASRGFVTVSVDEDFLNGSWAADWGGSEQLARAWLLLLHLDQWRTWSLDPASPFHGRVDLDRVALIGHSRGGEAAAVAASLAARPAAPLAGLEPWPTGLRIRAVVAIAPSDGQYSGGSVVLRDTDYLTLHGGHDADATSWMGIRQYARTVVAPGGFKAAMWVYRANHGQFNSVWGRSDHGDLGGAILNLAPLQTMEAQQDVARTAIGAFLESSLHGRLEYRGLFRRPMIGREWLPADDVYVVRSADDRSQPLLRADGTSGIDGVTVDAVGFEAEVPRALPLRALMPDQIQRAVQLRWQAGLEPAIWSVDGLDSVVDGSAAGLRLALGNGALDTAAALPSLDLAVELTTTDGITVSLPLSRWGALPPPLAVRLLKDELLAGLASIDAGVGAPVEAVVQTYEIPFAAYAAVDRRFDAAHVSQLRLVVHRADAGALWIVEAGLLADD